MSALDAIGPVCGHAIDQDVADAASNALIDALDLLDQELGRKLETPLDEHGEISKGSMRSETLNNTDNLYYVWRIIDHC
ncbi:hypothetical protein GCG54_00007929 [Colletotrichum gloeosporioides]|uniref:Uncharacterized protein n=1 Tax=Colletotrichum gloeosporioides TaxID=474922 RepID=A0A8H4CQQ8_COLGL|nr:uncharacterized protein GCG54_00007929 [Colletotrichum gloeosporioides]KAF3808147.1 hypothetical protein GCG54_00007929 [Colletotrichum gloeosporioides]